VRQGITYMRCKCGARIVGKRCTGRVSHAAMAGSYTWCYRVDVGAPGGQRRQRSKEGFGSKSEALAAMSKLQGDVDGGTYVEPSRQSVAQYLTTWLAGVDVRASTASSYGLAVRRLLPHIGELPLQGLTRNHVRMAYKSIAETGGIKGGKLKSKTTHNVHLALTRALSAAVEDRLLTFNPAQAAHRLSGDRPEMKTWLGSELKAFLAQVEDLPTFPLWRLAASTGMRRGELLGLRWRDLDMDAARLSVRQQVARIRPTGTTDVVWGFGPPKTKAGKRSIALDRVTVAALQARRGAWAAEKVLAGEVYEDHDLVFCRPDGRYLDPDVVSQTFERLVAKSGQPRIRLHDLRHSHATLGLAAGVHPKVMQERLGHSSIAVTLDLYSHAVPALGADAADRIAAVVDGGF
jgi:integrase